MSPSTGKFRAALLGTGAIAEMHVRALRTIAGASLDAVCDLDADRARSFARRFGISRAYGSLDEMRGAGGIDVVHVLLPPAAHAAAAIACMEAGAHVFIEKPMAVSGAECAQIEAASAASGRSVGVNHNVVFTPALQRMIADARARKFGALEHLMLSLNRPFGPLIAGPHDHWMFAAPGNIVLELGVHPMSVIVRLMGEAMSATVMAGDTVTLDTGVPFHRTWQVALQCERGTAQLHLGVGKGFPLMQLEAIGQDAAAVVDLQRDTYRFSDKTPDGPAVEALHDSLRASGAYFSQGVGNFAGFLAGYFRLRPVTELFNLLMTASIRSFYAALSEGVKPPQGGAEGAAVIRSCDRIIAAAATQAAKERAHV